MIEVDTPAGKITVEEFGSYNEYPGVTVFINGEQVATVEYSNTIEGFQANVWEGDYQNDPAYHVEYPDLEER